MSLSKKKEHGHLACHIPNTKENRDKITDLNKLARKSNSAFRYRIRYRRPKNGYKGYGDGSVKKEDATCFSVYLKNTPAQEKVIQRQLKAGYDRSYEMGNKYRKLQMKYNKIILRNIVTGLIGKAEEILYNIDSDDDHGRGSWILQDQALNKLATTLINNLESEVEK